MKGFWFLFQWEQGYSWYLPMNCLPLSAGLFLIIRWHLPERILYTGRLRAFFSSPCSTDTIREAYVFFFLLGCFCGAWIGRRTVAPLFGKTVDIIFGIPVFFVKFSTKWLLFMIKRCNIFVCRVIRTLKTAITRIFRTAMGSSRVEKIKKTEKQKKYSE